MTRAAVSLLFFALFAWPASAIELQPWSMPVDLPAAQPGLQPDPSGSLLLSWVERSGKRNELRFARWQDGAWTSPKLAMAGEDWFVNWADTPAVLPFADGGLAAFALVKNGSGTYAYDVSLALSPDGERWNDAFTVHDDGSQTEHGFASMWREGDATLGIAWLDGRNTAGGSHDHGGHSGDGGGAMTLRAAQVGRDGSVQEDRELDGSTCDCCTTAVAHTANATWLAYRGRTADEVRDILVVRRSPDGEWHAPRVAFDDAWVMPACPVNGPSLASHDARVYLAWYTAPDRPRVRLAQLDENGRVATPPLEIGQDDVMGRVALATDADTVWLAWMSEDRSSAKLWLACFDPQLGERSRRVVAKLPRGRGTGLPRLALSQGRAHLVITDIVSGKPQLRGWQAQCSSSADE